MSLPPTDEDGIVKPHDDRQAIPDDAYVVRYVHRDQLIPNPDGTRLLTSAAFSETSEDQDRYQSMSVDIFDRLQKDNVDPRTRLPPNHEGAVLIPAGSLRKLGLQVGPDPMQSNDHYHAGVWGVKGSLRKKIKKRCCRWLIKPSDAAPIERP